MKKTHTILVPTMLRHFGIFAHMLEREGYHLKVLTNTGHEVVEEGLASVHNDMCYPALLAIGQLIDGVKNSGHPRATGRRDDHADRAADAVRPITSTF